MIEKDFAWGRRAVQNVAQGVPEFSGAQAKSNGRRRLVAKGESRLETPIISTWRRTPWPS